MATLSPADKKESCALAVRAGVNIEFPEPDCYLHLVELVRKGVLKESQLDDLVAPMLFWKFKMGLFDDPYVDPDEAERIVGCEENRKLALQAARETITLLKNANNLVPLNPGKIKSIAVIGPNADRELLGGYSGRPKFYTSLLEGIRAKVGDRVQVPYCEGCKITVGGSWNQDLVTPSHPEEDRKQIQEAVKVAQQADVVVLAIGGNEQTSREAWSLKHMGDRTRLDLIGRQQELVTAMLATGKPVIVFLFNGSPLSIQYLHENVPVIFECWYLGQETGHAVADVLFGDFNPGGKLPITIPRSAGHLPAFYNYKPSARRGYLFDDVSPLYPFGFGLSYTTFAFKKRPPGEEKNPLGTNPRSVLVDVTEHRQTRRDGSRADVYSRLRQFGHPAGQGIERLPENLLAAGRNPDRGARHHARIAGVLRHPHEIRRRAGRIRNHGRQFLARRRFAEGDFDGDAINRSTNPDYGRTTFPSKTLLLLKRPVTAAVTPPRTSSS